MSALDSNPADAPERAENETEGVVDAKPKMTKEEKKAAAAAKFKAKRDAMVDFVPEVPEGETRQLLTSGDIPEGFDKAKHHPLKKSDFAEEVFFLDYKANEAEAKAAAYRKDAATLRKLGSAADQKTAKKLMGMQQRMADLARELAQDGKVNLSEILGADVLAALLGNSDQSEGV